MNSIIKTIMLMLTIAMLIFAVGCSKEESSPEPKVTTEPVPAVPVEEVTDVGVPATSADDTVMETDDEMTNESEDDLPDEEPEEELSDISEDGPLDDEDKLTADNYRVISLKDLNAYPKEMEITPGTTVEWRNVNDNFQHIIGWKNQKSMGVKPEPILAGESWSFTFTEVGKIEWFSTAKPTIQGTITIVPDKEDNSTIA